MNSIAGNESNPSQFSSTLFVAAGETLVIDCAGLFLLASGEYNAVENRGTIIVNGSLQLGQLPATRLVNHGKIVIQPISCSLAEIRNEYGIVTNYGTIEVNYSSVYGQGQIMNQGQFNNYGIITNEGRIHEGFVSGSFRNCGLVDNISNGFMENNGIIENGGIINGRVTGYYPVIAYSSCPPVDCILSDWSDWSNCSVECGTGVETRTRTILLEALNGGTCSGALEETRVCTVAGTDSDGDGTPDCNDQCPADANKILPGVCGCGTADVDSDGDGTADCNETGCPDVDTEAPVIASPLSIPIDPIALGSAANVSASFTDACDKNDRTATWNWGDGSSSAGTVNQGANSVSGSRTYATPGVYIVTLTVTDGSGNYDLETSTAYVVIYDASGGFVTGGGWIQSPAGALVSNPSATGKANFGFNSKYKKGATVPTGNTNFQFNAGNFHFNSSEYDWLVVAGEKAKFKGSGTVNNSGNYGFMVTGIDGDKQGSPGPDKLRIKIWDKNNGDAVVYDNKMGADDGGYDTQILGGGRIVIHSGGNGNSALMFDQPGAGPLEATMLEAYPNPFSNWVQLQIQLPMSGQVNLSIFNLQGQRVSTLVDEVLDAGIHKTAWDGRSGSGRKLPAGIYLVQLKVDGAFLNKRIVLQGL